MVIDVLFRIICLNNFQGIKFLKFTQLQKVENDFQYDLSLTTLKLRTEQMGKGEETLLCNTILSRGRPIVSHQSQRSVFIMWHNPSHMGVRVTIKLFAGRFHWPGANKDVEEWARSCAS